MNARTTRELELQRAIAREVQRTYAQPATNEMPPTPVTLPTSLTAAAHAILTDPTSGHLGGYLCENDCPVGWVEARDAWRHAESCGVLRRVAATEYQMAYTPTVDEET